MFKPRHLGLLRGFRLDMHLEARGQVPLEQPGRSPIVGSLSARLHQSEVSCLLATETPFREALGTFEARLFAAVNFTPRVFDKDQDGFEDDVDPCPHQPEDLDGFADSDGCPDRDNDQDGLLDEQDRCPSQAEDRDGFEDDDGCPDPDNDRDGLLDVADPCPNEKGPTNPRYKRPGCVPKDRDGDHIVDDFDRCPRRAEDRDGFEDDDGCPDRDNDKDGVRDRRDRCPKVHGPRSNRGCPLETECAESACDEGATE